MRSAVAGDSPEAVLVAYLSAMLADGVAAASARFTHPDECVHFKQTLMPRIRRSFEARDDFRTKIFGRDFTRAELEAMPPAEFLARFLWRSRIDGSNVKPPRFGGSTREGDVVHLVVLTSVTSLDGAATERRDVVDLKALGDTWRLMLDPKLHAYAQTLISE
jgi:hypothetical protein